MEATKTETEITETGKEETSLKGTLFSVGVVGAVIVAMWVAVFDLFMSRI